MGETMHQESIFIPFFGLMLLTIGVWLYMYYLRISFFKRENIDPQSVATTSELLKQVPARINTPSENLINLFELPVLFYAVCIHLFITKQVDGMYLFLAYSFLFFRVGHSAIHCTYNKVMHRFILYVLSSVVLWVFIIFAFIDTLKTM